MLLRHQLNCRVDLLSGFQAVKVESDEMKVTAVRMF